MMKKVAFVVQRYGKDVNGGAETLARQMAEHLNADYNVEVLTTKAIDYITWEDYYESDCEVINGVTVRRFSVEKTRDIKRFSKLCKKVLDNDNHTISQEEEWFDEQGPYTPALVQYIKDKRDEYDIFIFMTYLYYTTVKGLPQVKDKAILIPTAHDEAPVYLKTFREIFNMPKGLFYLTHEECEFTHGLFNNGNIIDNDGCGGSGIELPAKVNPDFVRDKYGIDNYVVYAGRIDVSKGCKELFKYFKKYKRHNKNDIKLVLMGKEVMKVPKSSNIISLGFVSEQEKYNIMSGAKALIMPSEFESLSIVVLEALGLGTPVICNGKCDVLKGHCIRSRAGVYYNDYKEFEAAVKKVSDEIYGDDTVRQKVRSNAIEYVRDNYTWDIIMKRFNEVIEACTR